MPTVRVNGVALHYQRFGRGPDVVMVHGLGANLAFWALAVAPALAGDFRVTVYDLRGHGRSEMPMSGYSSRCMALDLDALMTGLGLESAHLVGHSFGGEVALHLAVRWPERITTLTLADTRVRELQPTNRLQDWPDWRSVQRDLARAGVFIREDEREVGHRLLEELAVLSQRGAARAVPPSIGFPALAGPAMWGRRSAQRWLRLLATTTARADFTAADGPTRQRIGQLRHPLLAVYGDRSPCMPTLRELVRVAPGCQAVTLPGAGHFYPVATPAPFVRNLRAFLSAPETAGWRGESRSTARAAGLPQRREPQRGHSLTGNRPIDAAGG